MRISMNKTRLQVFNKALEDFFKIRWKIFLFLKSSITESIVIIDNILY